jgi:hypothetical protein
MTDSESMHKSAAAPAETKAGTPPHHNELNFRCERNLPKRFVDYDKPCTCEPAAPVSPEDEFLRKRHELCRTIADSIEATGDTGTAVELLDNYVYERQVMPNARFRQTSDVTGGQPSGERVGESQPVSAGTEPRVLQRIIDFAHEHPLNPQLQVVRGWAQSLSAQTGKGK